ncbi:MAG: hypothetical protein QM638_15080 [Nocardioides sp.]|uniref:hypothetical protein n=1 Tax=Nocardioides sp. TaxID=35761 RepID=UPI0039E558B0
MKVVKDDSGIVSEASAKVVEPTAPQSSLDAAKLLAEEAGRRIEIPMRMAFVRNDDPDTKPPLARLIIAGGRGGAVPLKLYLALIWRCSAEPFETDILARHWAELLGLEEPATLGARRVTRALDLLAKLDLVKLTKRRGESTIVRLLEESGSGAPYTLPSTAYALAETPEEKALHRYFKVPPQLWTNGDIQLMSAAAFAMLLVFSAERNVDGRRTWWSTERFPRLFNLSPSVRSQGTAELEDRGLISVKKQLVTNTPAPTFTRQRVRHTYKLRRHARPEVMIEQMNRDREAARKTAAAEAEQGGESELKRMLREYQERERAAKSTKASAKKSAKPKRTLTRKASPPTSSSTES